MDHLVDRLLDVLEKHDDTHHLDTAAGGPCTATHNHHDHRRDEEESTPRVIVVIGALEACVRQQSHHMEQRSTDAVQLSVRMRHQLLVGDDVEARGKIETKQEQHREEEYRQQVPTQLFVSLDHVETTIEEEMIHGEIDARQQHEQHANKLYVVGAEISDACLMCAETASGNGGHGMTDGVEPVHRSHSIGDGTKHSQRNVDDPQQARGGAHGRSQLLHTQAWRLGSEERGLLGAFGHRRQECQGEHHDAQTSHPLGDATPEQDAVWLLVDVVEDGGTRRREARHGLKEGIGDVVDRAIHQERQHTEDGEQHP